MCTNKIDLRPYDPEWKNSFNLIKQGIQHDLSDLILAIEHVGSTSVTGLIAKPILDIDIVIDCNELLPEIITRFKKLGYEHEGDLGILGREAFRKTNSSVTEDWHRNDWMKHHLYVCTKDNEELKKHIMFRDFLRTNPEIVRKYGQLKRNLANSSNHREAYTAGKTEFIKGILDHLMQDTDLRGS
ncbi:GrpB family protein [Pseudalkalibacillus sp. Hm43]|uniref:GrpB family protein n=1 Tax=Pseudalkalibacillus sp. Hm43 TaxID=3450742 RepID=UPI003F436936